MPRLFVALRPPEPVLDALLDAMGGIDGARWQDDEQLHCTLAFLGAVENAEVEPLIAALEEVESAPFAAEVAGVSPEKRHYRPHITLARLPRSAGPIGDWLARNGRLRAGPWEVTGFTLYESTLSPAGAAYDPLVEYEF